MSYLLARGVFFLNVHTTSPITHHLSLILLPSISWGISAEWRVWRMFPCRRGNTCSVTEMADKKCRQAIHRLVKQHPGAFVVVTGCYAQLKPGDVAKIDGVDVVLGAEQKGELLQYLGDLQKHEKGEAITTTTKDIRSFSPSCSRGDRTRFFLKVQDGCDYFCSYCTIPFARGRSRNGTIASMVEQARQAAAEGGKEIVLTGVNIGDFGKTTGESFFDLVKALDQVEGIERYRISSIEPNLLTDAIIEFVSHSRSFMPAIIGENAMKRDNNFDINAQLWLEINLAKGLTWYTTAL